MKRILTLTVVLVLGLGVAQAQSLMEKRADYYASAAIEEFGLDASKKQDIYEAKLNTMKVQKKMVDMRKGGASDAELEAFKKENMRPAFMELNNSIGKKWAELKDFNKRVNEEIKTVM